jgi:AhpD family alkylhydroperoxidase
MQTRIDLMTNELGAKLAKRLAGVHMVVQQTALPESVQALVMTRASQINGCGHCLDMHTKEALAAGETEERLNLVAGWRHSTVFTDAEQAALALTEEGTRIADASEGVSDETWTLAAKHYTEDELVALVTVISMINATNRMAVMLNQQGGSYTAGMFAEALG